MVLIKKSKTKPTNNNKKEYLKILKQADSINMLEKILEKLVIKKTGLSIKSQHRKEIISCFTRVEEKELLDDIIMDLEKDKVNKKQDLDKIRVKIKNLVELLL